MSLTDVSNYGVDIVRKFKKRNPEHKDDNIRIRFALSQKQRDELLKIANETNYKHYLIIRTQLETGMRIGEISHLAISSLNFAENYVQLERRESSRYLGKWKPKSKAGNRIIPIDKDLSNALRGFIGTRKDGHVFESNKIGSFSEISLINMINSYARKCLSIHRNIGSHALRRTYASYLMANGVVIGKISKILGHKSVQITMRYLFDIIDIGSYADVRKVVSKMNQDVKK